MEQQNIPYFAHEGIVARMERINRRLWILCIILIVLLAATNGAWLYFESQFEDVITTETKQDITQETDGSGNNTFVGGDVYGETENQKDN